MELKGTTLVALKFRDGVVLGADRQVTDVSRMKPAFEMTKIVEIDNFSAVALAGSPGLGFEIIKVFKEAILSESRARRKSISFKGKANFLSNLIRRNMLPLLNTPLCFRLIFAGIDSKKKDPYIFDYEPDGMTYEIEGAFHVIGMGDEAVTQHLKEGLSRKDVREIREKEAVAFVVRAIFEASEGNLGTGRNQDIFVITKKGIERVSQEQIKKLINSFLKEGG